MFVRSPAYNKLKAPTKAGGKASCAQCLIANKKALVGWGRPAPKRTFRKFLKKRLDKLFFLSILYYTNRNYGIKGVK